MDDLEDIVGPPLFRKEINESPGANPDPVTVLCIISVFVFFQVLYLYCLCLYRSQRLHTYNLLAINR
jgi:hypothetical protein